MAAVAPTSAGAPTTTPPAVMEKDHALTGARSARLENPMMEKHSYPNGLDHTQAMVDKHAYTNGHSPTTPHTPTAYSKPTAQPHAGPSTGPPHSHHLLSTHLLAHPDHTAKRAIHTQFPLPNPLVRLFRRFRVKHSVIKGMTEHEWKRFEKRAPELMKKAGWKPAGSPAEDEGVEVGELFWKMYLSLLPTVERDPLSGLVPPDLLGSTTTVPLTVISLIPDIMQHYHDVIIRAKEEVFLATNYWQPSNSVTTITGSLLELSALVVKEKRKKIVVKIMYDRGSFEQIWNSHAPVAKEKWKPLDLPGPDEIPGLEMEVINFHRVLLGTFHAKFLIVDRKVALINSNNIQDRPNLELMSHLEGPVVDSFYEVALHSWYNQLSPPLPCLSTPYTPPKNPITGEDQYLFAHDNPFFDDIEELKAAKAARILLRQQTMDEEAEAARLREEGGIAPGDRLRDAVKRVVDHQRQNLAEWRPGERFDESVQNAMHELREMRERYIGTIGGEKGSRSRPGSRGPSRRGSANEGMFRSLLKGNDRPAADHTPPTTATATTAVDPSEAPSSPTIAETPLKKGYQHPDSTHFTDDNSHSHSPINGNGTGHKTPTDDVELSSPTSKRHSQPHVAFAPLTLDQQTNTGPRNSLSGDNTRQTTGNLVGPGTVYADRLSGQAGGVASGSGGVVGERSIPSSPVTARSDLPIEGYPQPHLGVDDEGAEGQVEREGSVMTDSIVPEGTGSKRLYKMSKMFNAAGVLSEAWATVEDSDELFNFKPHVVHKPHGLVPVAMACRKPHGFPGHHDIRNPQNAAWLAGFRYAKKRIFIQTPTLNARPIVRAIKQACRRSVSVQLLLDLGFNDKGESIPFQGGTNEEVVVRLYKALRKEKKEQYLQVYWYTGKDQVRPLNAVKKQRNCHIKFAAYDDEVLIIGNGNQDSQSWFHSQEVNVMVNSKQLIAEMMETLLTNQNTIQYGLVDTDGIWRDKDGKTLQDYGATEGGRFKGLSGFIAFAKTI